MDMKEHSPIPNATVTLRPNRMMRGNPTYKQGDGRLLESSPLISIHAIGNGFLLRLEEPCLLFLLALLLPFAIPVTEKVEVRSHNDGVLHKLLHAINEPVSVAAGHEPAPAISGVWLSELRVSFWYRALV